MPRMGCDRRQERTACGPTVDPRVRYPVLCQLVVPPLAFEVVTSESKEWQERVTRRLTKAPYVQKEVTMVFLGRGGKEDG